MSLGSIPAGSTPSEEWGYKVLEAVDGALEQVGATASTGGYVEAKTDRVASMNANNTPGFVTGSGLGTSPNVKSLAQGMESSTPQLYPSQVTSRSLDELSGREQAASQLLAISSRQEESPAPPELRDTQEAVSTVSLPAVFIPVAPISAVPTSAAIEPVFKAPTSSAKQEAVIQMDLKTSTIPKRALPDLMPARHLPVDTPMVEHLPGGWIGSAYSGDNLGERSTVLQDVVAGLDSVGHAAYDAVPQSVKDSINPNRPGPSFINRAQTYIEGVHIPEAPHIELPKLPNVQLPSLPNVQLPSLPNVQLPSLPEIHFPALVNYNSTKKEATRLDASPPTAKDTQRAESPEDEAHMKRIASDILSGARSPAEQAYYNTRSAPVDTAETESDEQQVSGSPASQSSSSSEEQSDDKSRRRGSDVGPPAGVQRQPAVLANPSQDLQKDVTTSSTPEFNQSPTRSDTKSGPHYDSSEPLDRSTSSAVPITDDSSSRNKHLGRPSSPIVYLQDGAGKVHDITVQPLFENSTQTLAQIGEQIETSPPSQMKADYSYPSQTRDDYSIPFPMRADYSTPSQMKADHSTPFRMEDDHSHASQTRADYSTSSLPSVHVAEPTGASHISGDLAPPLELVVENDPIFERTQRAPIGRETQPIITESYEVPRDTVDHQASRISLDTPPIVSTDASIPLGTPSSASLREGSLAPPSPPLGTLDHPSADRTDSSASITAVKHGHLGHSSPNDRALATVSEKPDRVEQPVAAVVPSAPKPSVSKDSAVLQPKSETPTKTLSAQRQSQPSQDARSPTIPTNIQPTRTTVESGHMRTESEVSTASKKKGFLSKLKNKLHHDK